jgi:acyl-CoA hydrolase
MFNGTITMSFAEMGDIIFLSCLVVELRKKAIVVDVEAYRERRAKAGRDLIAKANFVFVTKKDRQFYPHGLSFNEKEST